MVFVRLEDVTPYQHRFIRFSGPSIRAHCKQMAALTLILKCQKTVKACFDVSPVKEWNGAYVFNWGLRYFSRGREDAGKQKFDVVVIGGGSGGLSCAKEARALGATVCVIDYVTPTPKGTTWGMGGTCVNVGCIPKKLMHQAALLGEGIREAAAYGWIIKDIDTIKIDWDKLKEAVQNHIKSVNWVTRVALRENKIQYINGIGKFIDDHTIEVKVKDDVKQIIGNNIVIAVGGRPKYPNIPGAVEYGISSDDIFNLPHPPGKTLIVGAGYADVALECAGFLNSFKYPVTVMVRSVVLRSFDRQMADLVTEHMKEKGITFWHKMLPTKIEQNGKRLKVTYECLETKKLKSEEFDSVLFAIGRRAVTEELNIEAIGLSINKSTGKIMAVDERTNIDHIYAVGDVLDGKPELSPVAIEAGRLLARRMLGKSKEVMNYENIATTVFAPLEYGCVGLTEEIALEKYGEDNIEIYHAYYKPIEFYIPQKSVAQCYLKVIALRKDPMKVLGMHFVGPTAGEVIQGYAAAIKCGFTMDQLMGTVGIHPTVSEEFTRLIITKRSGLDPTPASCCN